MKTSTLVIAVLALGVGFCAAPGCQAPDAPDLSNPLDPTDPDYVQPLATITAGPSDGETVEDADVSFTWSGTDRVNAFRHRLNGSEWTEWLPETSVDFPLLDEGEHVFEVVSRYPTGDEQTTPTTRTFTMDAVKGPALMFRPRRVVVPVGDTFSVEVIAEEVEDLMGARIAMAYDGSSLSLQAVEEGGFLGGNGGTVVFLDGQDSGTLTFDTAVAEGTPAGVTGTGSLATLTFRAEERGEVSLAYGAGSALRDATNLDIRLNTRELAVVVIRQETP